MAYQGGRGGTTKEFTNECARRGAVLSMPQYLVMCNRTIQFIQ